VFQKGIGLILLCMGSRDECERRGNDLSGNAHPLETNLESERAVVEKAHILRLVVGAQFPRKTLDDRAVVREPAVVPDLLDPFHEFVQRRKKGFCYENRLVEGLRRHIQLSWDIVCTFYMQSISNRNRYCFNLIGKIAASFPSSVQFRY